MRKKEAWRRWREKGKNDDEENGEGLGNESEEEWMIEEEEKEDWRKEDRKFCDNCALTRCCCHLVKLEEKIRQIKEEERRKEQDDLNLGPDREDSPGLGNFCNRRAYQEILPKESIAPSKAGRPADLGGEECLERRRKDVDSKDDEGDKKRERSPCTRSEGTPAKRKKEDKEPGTHGDLKGKHIDLIKPKPPQETRPSHCKEEGIPYLHIRKSLKRTATKTKGQYIGVPLQQRSPSQNHVPHVQYDQHVDDDGVADGGDPKWPLPNKVPSFSKFNRPFPN